MAQYSTRRFHAVSTHCAVVAVMVKRSWFQSKLRRRRWLISGSDRYLVTAAVAAFN